MDKDSVNGVIFTTEKRIKTSGGDILHGIKKNQIGYIGFGEAYFSFLEYGAIKAWKKHHDMTLNILVPVGEIRFVIYDDRTNSVSNGHFFDITISAAQNYGRLTVPPLVWLGFKGENPENNLLLNVASHPHSNTEVERCELTDIPFNW